MAATRYYVDIENLKTFWSKAKVFIQALSVNGTTFGTNNAITLGGGDITVGGSGDYKSSTLQAAINDIDGRLDTLGNKDTELSTLISNLRTDLTTETTNRTNADTTHTQAISEINNYTVNAKKISTNPVLTGGDITLGSELDETDYPATQSITNSIDKLREDISEINAYKVNDKLVSSSPTLTGNDVNLGTTLHSDYPADQSITESIDKLRQTITGATIGGGMQLIGPPMTTLPETTNGYSDGNVIIVGTKEYLCYNGGWIELGDVDAVSQSVSEILASYVKSVTTTDGTYVKLTPDSATNGDVTVAVDDASITTALAERVSKTGDTMSGPLTITSGNDTKIVLNNTDADNKYQYISFQQNGSEYGILGTLGNDNISWNRNVLLRTDNVANYALPITGGTLTSAGATTLILMDTARNESAISYVGNGGVTWFVGKGVGSIGEKFGFYNGSKGVVANLDIDGNFTATKFIGALQGNADTATTSISSGYVNVTPCSSTSNSKLWDGLTVDALKVKFWDVYNDGGPSAYGNILEINGIANHWKPQLWFEGKGNGARVYYRNRTYNAASWGGWQTLAFTSDIPTNVSQLTNDAGYTTATGHTHSYLPLAGGTMTGRLTLLGGQYDGTTTTLVGALDCNNSNIIGVNNITTCDKAESGNEGLRFWRSSTTNDCIWAADGVLNFSPNLTIGATSGTTYTVIHSGNCTTYCAPASHTHDWSDINNVVVASNEFNFVPSGFNADIWLNFRGKDFTSATVKSYRFGNGSSASGYAPCYATNFITSSDRRVKDNITEIKDAAKSLELDFYEFDYKSGGHSAGHVAQDVRKVLPKFVHGNETETEYLSVDYAGLHSVQIKALKDKVETLKAENKELRERLEKLEKLVEKLV